MTHNLFNHIIELLRLTLFIFVYYVLLYTCMCSYFVIRIRCLLFVIVFINYPEGNKNYLSDFNY